ncbi:MAG: FtsX-like permease family protein [Bacteroidota bacterium]
MRIFIYNINHAFQNLKKNAAYSMLTIVGLTIGLTVFLVISLFIFNEQSVDHNIANYDRIYRLLDAKENNCGLDYELADVISQNYPEIEANCVFNRFEWPMVLRANNQSFKVATGISTTNSFFNVFDVQIFSKTAEKPFAEKSSIILTQSLSQKIFGDKNPLGESVNINNMFEAKVTAIIKGFPKNTSIEADYLLNAEDEGMRMMQVCNNGDCYNPMNHFLLFDEQTNHSQFISQFNQTIKPFQTRVDSFGIQALTNIYLSEYKEGNSNKMGNPSFIQIISIIALIILFLAIINYLNFSMSLQHSKIKEISIKKINGADSLQLFFYYLAESLIVIIISTLFSLFVVFAFTDAFATVLGGELNMQILQTPVFITVFLVVLVIILLINSIIPAYSLLKLNVVEGLNNGVKRNDKSNIKIVFTTTQFVASIVLLTSVFFIQKQLTFIESKDLGFAQQNLLKVEIPYKFKNYSALKQGFDELSFVESSTYSNGTPGEINLTLGGGENEVDINFQTILCDSNFMRTFQIQLLEGRNFLSGDFHKSCMYNEAAIKKLGWDNLKNRKLNNGREGGYDVIGIVKDFNVSSLHNKQEPVCIIFDDNNKPNTMSIRITPGHINQQLEQIKNIWASLTDDPFEFQFYDEFFDAQYQKERQLSKSITLLAIIAIILTLIGILGQVIQTCIYRTKEIGIRKVNGATIAEIMFMLNKDFIKWVVLSFVIATPIAWYAMNKWLENFAYKTELSWWIFALAGIITMLTALLTVSWQTFKAARRNPVEALRYE